MTRPKKAPVLRPIDKQYLDAVAFGTLDDVKDAVAGGADPHVLDPEKGENGMNAAARRSFESPSFAQYLDRLEVNIHLADQGGQKPMHYFAQYGHIGLIQMALKRGEQVDVIAGRSQRTPLMFAVSKGHVDAMDFLLKSGAEINAVDHVQTSVLHLARTSEAIEFLVSRGAVVDARNATGMTPLYYALEHRHDLPCIERLLVSGADPDTYCGGLHATHFAAWLANGRALVMLLEAGADPANLTHTGESVPQMWEAARPRAQSDDNAAYDAFAARQALRTLLRTPAP